MRSLLFYWTLLIYVVSFTTATSPSTFEYSQDSTSLSEPKDEPTIRPSLKRSHPTHPTYPSKRRPFESVLLERHFQRLLKCEEGQDPFTGQFPTREGLFDAKKKNGCRRKSRFMPEEYQRSSQHLNQRAQQDTVELVTTQQLVSERKWREWLRYAPGALDALNARKEHEIRQYYKRREFQ